MKAKSLILAFCVGLSAFLLVGIAVTSVAQRWLEFSLLLGLPAGLMAGVFAGGSVAVWLAPIESPERHRVVRGLAGQVWIAVPITLFLAPICFGWYMAG